MIIIMLNLNN